MVRARQFLCRLDPGIEESQTLSRMAECFPEDRRNTLPRSIPDSRRRMPDHCSALPTARRTAGVPTRANPDRDGEVRRPSRGDSHGRLSRPEFPMITIRFTVAFSTSMNFRLRIDECACSRLSAHRKLVSSDRVSPTLFTKQPACESSSSASHAPKFASTDASSAKSASVSSARGIHADGHGAAARLDGRQDRRTSHSRG